MLKKKGRYHYGDSQEDIRAEIARYSKLNEYEATLFADARCSCGSRRFRLFTDETEGAAVRVCCACEHQHFIGDSSSYIAEAQFAQSACVCDEECLEITAGVATYEVSAGVRWLYIGCRCPTCDVVGVYGDWKNEHENAAALLSNV